MVMMRQQNECRVINEDVAALRNITWAAMQRFSGDASEQRYARAYQIWTIASLLLFPSSSDNTIMGIKYILKSYNFGKPPYR
jgi:hypothetical protein